MEFVMLDDFDGREKFCIKILRGKPKQWPSVSLNVSAKIRGA